jgi:peptide/nickel transport system permease protein
MESTLSYLLRRLLWVPPVLFVVSFFTFALVRLGPGDPIRIASGQFRDPEAFERIRHARGLNQTSLSSTSSIRRTSSPRVS